MGKLILIFLIACSALANSQNYSGQVLNSKSKSVLSYVTIGIPGLGVGTITDQDGKYSMDLQNELNNDTLRFLLIGYKSFSICINDFKKSFATENAEILLEEIMYDLSEIVVKPKTMVIVNKGNTITKHKSNHCMALFTLLDTVNNFLIKKKRIKAFSGKHIEMGTLFEIEKRETYIDKVRLEFCPGKYDSIILRLNIYSNFKYSEKGHVLIGNQNNILRSPIYFTIYNKTEVLELDLTSYSIKVGEDFIVSFETLKPDDCYKIKIPYKNSKSGSDFIFRLNPLENTIIRMQSLKLLCNVTLSSELKK